MQRAGRLLAALLLARGAASTRVVHRGHRGPGQDLYAEDVEGCNKTLNRYFTAQHPTTKEAVTRMMVDSCYRNVPVDSRPVICPHLERVLTDSLWKVSPLEMLSPEVVCERTEAHLSELQGVARVPRVGSGRIHTFETKKTCEPTVEAALDGASTILSPNVPNFWYALCLNQDCAHMLPSRTKWCNTSRTPTHSAAVCAAARTFVLRTVESKPPYSMRPVEVCSLFSEFHKEMATDVAAYRNRVHGDVFPSKYITKQEPRGFSVMAWLRSLGVRSSARPAFGQPALWASLGPLLSVLIAGLL